MKPLEPFEKIPPAGPLVPDVEGDLTEADNNAAYVDNQYADFAAELRYHISVTKQDLTEPFPPSEIVRLERLLGIYRTAWEGLIRAVDEEARN